MRLEKRIEGVLPLHKESMDVYSLRVSIPIQMDLEARVPLSKSKRGMVMGTFYEYLNRALYGGKLNDLKYDIENPNGDLGEDSIKPDVIDHDNRVVWEAKACRASHSCNIMNRQLEGYKYIQYIYPDAKILFALYRHTLKGIKSKPTEGFSEEDIVRELTNRTMFSVVLPLSLILRLQEIPRSHGINHARLYEGGREWPDCLVINPRTIDGFLFEPEKILTYLDLNPKDFEIERYKTPVGLQVNRRKIKPFPIVRVLSRKPWEWAEEFLEKQHGNLEIMKEDIGDLPLFEGDEEIPF